VSNLVGTLSLNGGGVHSGSFLGLTGTRFVFDGTQNFGTNSLLAGGGTASLRGTENVDGTCDIAGPLDIPGTVTFGPGANVRFSGRQLNLSGTGIFNTGTQVNLHTLNLSGTIDGSDRISVTNAFVFTNGVVQGTGVKATTAGATMSLSGNPDLYVTGVLENGGTALWTSGRIWAYSDGIVHNLSSGNFEMRGNLQMTYGHFENDGVVSKSAGTNITDFSASFANHGTLTLQAGTIALHGGATNSGQLNLATNTVLKTDGPILDMEPGATVTGPGSLQVGALAQLLMDTDVDFGNATVSFTGSSTITGSFRLSNSPGGVFSIDHDMTISGSMTIGGRLVLTTAQLTVSILRDLTLLPNGTIDNPGALRVGTFTDNGGTVVGNEPIIVGPPVGQARIVALTFPPLSGASRSRFSESSLAVQLTWETAGNERFALQYSHDFVRWQTVAASVRQIAPGHFQAELNLKEYDACFFRVISDR
jgi:hypothetical protein